MAQQVGIARIILERLDRHLRPGSPRGKAKTDQAQNHRTQTLRQGASAAKSGHRGQRPQGSITKLRSAGEEYRSSRVADRPTAHAPLMFILATLNDGSKALAKQ